MRRVSGALLSSAAVRGRPYLASPARRRDAAGACLGAQSRGLLPRQCWTRTRGGVSVKQRRAEQGSDTPARVLLCTQETARKRGAHSSKGSSAGRSRYTARVL